MTLIKYKPYGLRNHLPFRSLWSDMNDIFEDYSLQSLAPNTDFVPAIDIKENAKNYTITAELAGINEKDIDLTFDNGVLTIKGEKKTQEKKGDDNDVRVERTYGSFQRSMSIPTAIDESAIQANFKNGLLTVTLPKTTEQASTRKIAIES